MNLKNNMMTLEYIILTNPHYSGVKLQRISNETFCCSRIKYLGIVIYINIITSIKMKFLK